MGVFENRTDGRIEMKKRIAVLTMLVALAACNTVQGVGQDVQSVGKAVEKVGK